jgi:hypothetical protein
VSWNGNTESFGFTNNKQWTGYTEYQFNTTTANTTSSTLLFTSTNTGNFHLDNVSVTPLTPTPIPAAAWLLGSGLMGLFGIRRKEKV